MPRLVELQTRRYCIYTHMTFNIVYCFNFFLKTKRKEKQSGSHNALQNGLDLRVFLFSLLSSEIKMCGHPKYPSK